MLAGRTAASGLTRSGLSPAHCAMRIPASASTRLNLAPARACQPRRHLEVRGDARDPELGDLPCDRRGQLIGVGRDETLGKSEMQHRRMVR